MNETYENNYDQSKQPGWYQVEDRLNRILAKEQDDLREEQYRRLMESIQQHPKNIGPMSVPTPTAEPIGDIGQRLEKLESQMKIVIDLMSKIAGTELNTDPDIKA